MGRGRAVSGRSADLSYTKNNVNTASFDQLPSRANGSFDGFADKVRKQQEQSSTHNNSNN